MKTRFLFVILTLILICKYDFVYAARGCCSWHGGIAGCDSSGKYICADGTLSPSCRCTPSYIYGCTDPNAKNYNSSANKNDGSCTYYKYGCIDSSAKNYDSSAEKDDGSCTYYKYGCIDSSAKNYDSSAEKDDGSCTYYKYGCVDSSAKNYDPNAEKDDGSCTYKEEFVDKITDSDDINIEVNTNSDGIIIYLIYLYLVLCIALLVLSYYIKNLNPILAKKIHNVDSYFFKFILYPLYVITILPLIIDLFSVIDGIIHK